MQFLKDGVQTVVIILKFTSEHSNIQRKYRSDVTMVKIKQNGQRIKSQKDTNQYISDCVF